MQMNIQFTPNFIKKFDSVPKCEYSNRIALLVFKRMIKILRLLKTQFFTINRDKPHIPSKLYNQINISW